MEELKEILLNIEFMKNFTFQRFLYIIAGIYDQNPQKREIIMQIMNELYLLPKIRRVDVMIKTSQILDNELEQQHLELYWHYMEEEELYEIIKTNPLMHIANQISDKF